MVHVQKIQKQKWDKKADKLILVGYPENVKIYRLYNLKTFKNTTSRDVIIIEKEDLDTTQMVIKKIIKKKCQRKMKTQKKKKIL